MVVKTREPVKVSATLDMTGWKYYWNDQEVDLETYERLTKEHLEWVKEEEKRVAAAQACPLYKSDASDKSKEVNT